MVFRKQIKGCEYEVDFLFDNVSIEKILFITDQQSISTIKNLLIGRWEMLIETSPNFKIINPKVQIYMTSGNKYNDRETQDIIDILLFKSFDN